MIPDLYHFFRFCTFFDMVAVLIIIVHVGFVVFTGSILVCLCFFSFRLNFDVFTPF